MSDNGFTMISCDFKRVTNGKCRAIFLLISLLIICSVSGLIILSGCSGRATARGDMSPVACTANTMQDTVSVIDIVP